MHEQMNPAIIIPRTIGTVKIITNNKGEIINHIINIQTLDTTSYKYRH